MLDLFCYCFILFMVNLWNRYAKKLRNIILLRFELITFRFAYTRTRKSLISMISGLSDVSVSPKTNIIYPWSPQDTQHNPRKIPNNLKIQLFSGDDRCGFLFFEKTEVCAPEFRILKCRNTGTLKL